MTDHGIGTIQHMMVAMASDTRELLKSSGPYEGSAAEVAPDPDTWSSPHVSGGGYAPAQLSHAMGVTLWLTGDRARQVFALMNNDGAGVDLYDAMTVRYDSGATGTVSGASCPSGANAIDGADEPWSRHQLQVRLYGDEGQLVVDLERDFVWLFREDGIEEKVGLPEHAGLYLCDGPPNTIVDLTRGRDVNNRSPSDLGARTVEVVAAAYESIRAGSLVDVQ